MKKFLLPLVFIALSQKLFCQPQQTTTDNINNYFNVRGDSLNPIEGIWDVASTMEYYHHDTLYDVVKSSDVASIAVIKKDDKFQSYYISGTPYEAEFSSTDVKGVYLYRILYPQSNTYSGIQAVISKFGEMEYTYDFPDWYFGTKPGIRIDEGLRVVNVLKWKKHSSTEKR